MRLDASNEEHNSFKEIVDKFKYNILTYTILLVIAIGLFFIFKNEIISFFINYIVLPFFSKFHGNNPWGGIGLVLILSGIYSYISLKEWNRCTLPIGRYTFEIVFLH